MHTGSRLGERHSTHGVAGTQSDEQLLVLARLGHEAAFEAIVERYRSPLLGHCRRVAGGSCAQDALQQAFLSAWRALRSDCEVRSLRSWLFTIAHRSALQALREQRKRSDELPCTPAGTRTPAEEVEQSIRTHETLAAIAALPPLERDALVSTAVHGRSGRDTARALGMSEDTVRQLVFRARARTRAAVHVFAPPALLTRLSDGVRRVTALGKGNPSAFSPATGGMLVKIAAVVAAGTLLGARMDALHRNEQHRPATSAPAVLSRSSGPLARSGASAAADHARARARNLRASARPRMSARVPVLSHEVPGRVSGEGTGARLPLTGAPAVPTSSSTAVPSRAPKAAHAPLETGYASNVVPQPVERTHAPVAEQVTLQATTPLRQLTAPARALTAPLRQLTAPVRQVIAGAVGQLPQSIAHAAQGIVQTGTQPAGQITTDVTQQTADKAHGGLLASPHAAPLTPIKSLLR